MNFQEFNERFGPVQNINGGMPGVENLIHYPNSSDMGVIQQAPKDHVWTVLSVNGARTIVNGYIVAANRIGHMLTTERFDADEHFEVDFGRAP